MLELHGLELKLLCRRIGDADNVIETTLTCATEEQPSMSVNESTIRRPNTFPGIICKLTGVSLTYIIHIAIGIADKFFLWFLEN